MDILHSVTSLPHGGGALAFVAVTGGEEPLKGVRKRADIYAEESSQKDDENTGGNVESDRTKEASGKTLSPEQFTDIKNDDDLLSAIIRELEGIRYALHLIHPHIQMMLQRLEMNLENSAAADYINTLSPAGKYDYLLKILQLRIVDKEMEEDEQGTEISKDYDMTKLRYKIINNTDEQLSTILEELQAIKDPTHIVHPHIQMMLENLEKGLQDSNSVNYMNSVSPVKKTSFLLKVLYQLLSNLTEEESDQTRGTSDETLLHAQHSEIMSNDDRDDLLLASFEDEERKSNPSLIQNLQRNVQAHEADDLNDTERHTSFANLLLSLFDNFEEQSEEVLDEPDDVTVEDFIEEAIDEEEVEEEVHEEEVDEELFDTIDIPEIEEIELGGESTALIESSLSEQTINQLLQFYPPQLVKRFETLFKEWCNEILMQLKDRYRVALATLRDDLCDKSVTPEESMKLQASLKEIKEVLYAVTIAKRQAGNEDKSSSLETEEESSRINAELKDLQTRFDNACSIHMQLKQQIDTEHKLREEQAKQNAECLNRLRLDESALKLEIKIVQEEIDLLNSALNTMSLDDS